MSARLIATRIIQRIVEEQHNLSHVLADDRAFIDAGESRALIQELCYGTLRWYFQLERLLDLLLDKPVRKKDRVLKYLLLCGLYQLKYMRIPPHAVVSETVTVCRALKKDSARGLVNAVLRRYQREAPRLEIEIGRSLSCETAHPEWLIKRLQQDWPDNYREMLAANNTRPPMTLRINQQKTNRDQYLVRLKKENIEARATPYSAVGIELLKPCPVEQLPCFNEGWASVQDLAAQLASDLMQLQPGQTVLDACAAPGGKSAHILESQPKLKQLVVVEKDKHRAEKILETLQRLQLSAKIRISDLLHLEHWWEGELFDRILLDAPCSATGVIRRHPDIKLLRTAAQVDDINEMQQQLLAAAWQTLKPGGLLVYATCSVLKQENSDTIKQFLSAEGDCKLAEIEMSWGVNTGYGQQILTGVDNMDGFFYAVIRKNQSELHDGT